MRNGKSAATDTRLPRMFVPSGQHTRMLVAVGSVYALCWTTFATAVVDTAGGHALSVAPGGGPTGAIE